MRNAQLVDLPLFAEPPKPEKLSQVDRIFMRMMEVRSDGLTTVELLQKMYCANYTGRLSDGRNVHGLGRGHQYHGARMGKLPGGGETAQWIYYYTGFNGDRTALKSAVKDALRRWETWRASVTSKLPWEEV